MATNTNGLKLVVDNEGKDAKLREAQEMLDKGISDVLTSDKWKEYLKVQAKFHHYSFNNAILIAMQFPDATRVAGFNTWKDLGRYVQKGEKGIRIFAPMIKNKEVEENGERETRRVLVGFRMVNVFDVSQTQGKDLPVICATLQGDSEEAGMLFDALMQIIDIPVKQEPISNGHGYFSPSRLIIALKEGDPKTQQAKTIIHEGSHYEMYKLKKEGLDLGQFLEDSEEGNGLYAVEEVIVESTAFIVSQCFGLDTGKYSFEYIANWSGGDKSKIKRVGEIIQKLSSQMINKVESILSETKETDNIAKGS